MEAYKKLMQENYDINSDASQLQFNVIHGYLSRSYWAKGIAMEEVEQAAKNALCFGVYKDGKQVGFARLITDYTRFGYLADVFILESHRGKGLSKWLMHIIMNQATELGISSLLLKTADAHGLYKQFGFTSLHSPDVFMEANI